MCGRNAPYCMSPQKKSAGDVGMNTEQQVPASLTLSGGGCFLLGGQGGADLFFGSSAALREEKKNFLFLFLFFLVSQRFLLDVCLFGLAYKLRRGLHGLVTGLPFGRADL